MSYYFPDKQALAKREETVKELTSLLAIEEANCDEFDKLAKEDIANGDNEKATIWLGYREDCDRYCSAWRTRIEDMNMSNSSLVLLDAHDRITIEEAFCILLGITPDTLDEEGFLNWRLTEIPRVQRVRREIFDEQISVGKTGIMLSFLNIEEHLRSTKEYKKLVREYGENNNDGVYETIDTQAFIKWALKLGYIETDKPHVLDKRNPPYEDDFAKMLHSLLLEKNIISGEFDEKWTWLSADNSLAYLVHILHVNGLPFKWHSDHPRKTKNWKNILHYVDKKSNSPLRNHANYGKEGVKDENLINQIIDKLLVDYEGYKLGRKDIE
jgi:hypothetical protein